jgi:hypothetical protein
MKKKVKPQALARPRRAATAGIEEHAESRGLLDRIEEHRETSPRLTAGDVDADWLRAEASGEEAAGGSVATPDQDTVDEIGAALGIERAPEEEVVTSEDILRRRDRFRWHLERDAEAAEIAREETEDARAAAQEDEGQP